MPTTSNPYRGLRYPAEVIWHAVWLCHCFSPSLRDVELILADRGMVVSYDSQPREHPRVGPALRSAVRHHTQATAAQAGRLVAPR